MLKVSVREDKRGAVWIDFDWDGLPIDTEPVWPEMLQGLAMGNDPNLCVVRSRVNSVVHKLKDMFEAW
jgi:hypothetical protein